jgi:phenylalanyl-tRNA synthetase beta chain
MHPVDIYEDVAIGYGFEKFGGTHTVTQTVGELSAPTRVSEVIRDMMVGLGYTEVTTLTIGSESDGFELAGLPATDFVKILNPISEDHTCLRSYLVPSSMRILVKNKHRDLPQRIFEVGDVVIGEERRKKLCALSTHSKASFTEAKSLAESILREMRIEYTLRPCQYRTFIDGRGAEVVSGGKQIGFFGEMSPQVITEFGIGHPVVLFEMDVSPFIGSGAKGVL